ncbi:MAG TPA: class I SAM-dependent methyltransferase [Actinomycetota bacterium]|jgi:SAM-dependent methyltransferase|nr:class I SAM-dependent methyltransferase [Actinomycetota bacterium]
MRDGNPVKYSEITAYMRSAYSGDADMRDGFAKQQWKLDERLAFLARLAPTSRLLEIGAGTGDDSVFFQQRGLHVVATDLTPQFVARCREKGLDAHVADVLNLPFEDGSFDAIWTLNCLLHVPTADMPAVFGEMNRVLRTGGLCYVGVHAGRGPSEGIWDEDKHDPPRFFVFRTDEELTSLARGSFDIIDFHTIVAGDEGWRFQSMTLCKR